MKPQVSPREANPCPPQIPEPDAHCTDTAVEGDEGGGTGALSNEEMKRPVRPTRH